MPETVYKSPFDDTTKWRWHDIVKDLIQQGGLEKETITIDPFTTTPNSCCGTYKSDPFIITWVPEVQVIVSMITLPKELVDAFSAIFGYKPWVKYRANHEGGISIESVEWCKKEHKEAFETIKGNPLFSDIEKLH